MRTKTRKIICMAIVLVLILLTITGCKDDTVTVDMAYSGSNVANAQMNMFGKQNASANFVGKDVCIVNKGEDVGNNSNITAISSLLFAVDDKKPIYANKIYDKVYPASITKIFTVYTALKSGKSLDDVVTVSKNAQDIKNDPGAKYGGLVAGDKMKLKDLLYYMMIVSANDAGIAVAEHVGKDVKTFAKMMNEEAKKAGCIGSNFLNPHGLHEDDHYTTAYDIYLVFNRLIKYDVFLDMVGKDSYSFTYTKADGSEGKLSDKATNKYFLGKFDPPKGIAVLGGKTGTTDEAGKCLIIASKNSEGKKFISLVLHADINNESDLYNQMNTLLSMIK